jgi:hypothetical protein
MSILKTVGGNELSTGAGFASRLSDDPAGSHYSVTKRGASQSYSASPYQAFTSMWGVFVGVNSNMVFTVDEKVTPALFPTNTTFDWNITPDPRYAGVNGYLFVSYGNYDDSVGGITPKQAKNITTMVLDVNWTFTGDAASGLLCECWLTTTSHATGPTSPDDGGDPVAEVSFHPKVSTVTQSYINGLTTVGSGSFTDIHGTVWNVRVDNGLEKPFYLAYRLSFADYQGPFDFKSYFTFLTTSGKITGNEWFQGAAFGVEPRSGAASLTINNFTTTYS